MTEASVSYDAGLHEDLRDPVEAAAYLNTALEDGLSRQPALGQYATEVDLLSAFNLLDSSIPPLQH